MDASLRDRVHDADDEAPRLTSEFRVTGGGLPPRDHHDRMATVNINDGGGGTDALGNPLVTSDIIFTGLDVSNADDTVALTWTQAQWQAATTAFTSLGSGLGTNTKCISVLGSVAHSVHEGFVINSNYSTVRFDEVYWYTDNAFSHDGSEYLWDDNWIHDPVDSGIHSHVDVSQQEAFPLPQGMTSMVFDDLELNHNLAIDRWRPDSPFATISATIIDDYSGEGYVYVTNLRVQNNVFISGGNCILYELNIQGAVISNNTCVPNSTTLNPMPSIELTLTNNQNVRVCDNIAPNIIVANNQPGVTFDNNVAVQYAAYIQNADGTWPANASFLQSWGWWDTNGHYSATQTATANNQTMSLASFMGLFNQAPTGVPPTYDVSLKPGATTNGSPTCGPQINAAGVLPSYWSTLNAAQAANTAAQATYVTNQAAAASADALAASSLAAATSAANLVTTDAAAPMAPGAY